MNNSIYPSAYTKKVLDQYNSPFTVKFLKNIMNKKLYASIVYSLASELFSKINSIVPESRDIVLVHEMNYSCYHRVLSLEERNFIIALVWKFFVDFLNANKPGYICVLMDGNDELCNATFEISKL